MDSRERTFLSLAHEEPDRVPRDVWLSSGCKSKIERELGLGYDAFLDDNDVDLRYIDGPRYIGPPLDSSPDGTDRDIWGVLRRSVVVPTDGGEEVYREVAHSPLADVDTIEQVLAYEGWPSPDWFDYSGIEEQCQRVRDQGRVAVFVGDRLNRLAQLKPAMYIRGMEQILIDMTLAPELAHAVIGQIREFYGEYAQRIFESAGGKLDIVLTGDDYGFQHGPLVSPPMWEGFIGEGFSEYTRLAKDAGLVVMHHTCGSVAPFIPLMIDRGLDVLQSLQPEAEGMDPGELKTRFGDRLSFHGGVSIQRTMPFGTTDEVRRAVRSRMEALAPGGGYIVSTSHNIGADTPVENIVALMEAYRSYGDYSP
jgi:uroporphyrinogen decarboxylase